MVTSSSSELLVEKKRMRRLVYKFNGLWHRHSQSPFPRTRRFLTPLILEPTKG